MDTEWKNALTKSVTFELAINVEAILISSEVVHSLWRQTIVNSYQNYWLIALKFKIQLREDVQLQVFLVSLFHEEQALIEFPPRILETNDKKCRSSF